MITRKEIANARMNGCPHKNSACLSGIFVRAMIMTDDQLERINGMADYRKNFFRKNKGLGWLLYCGEHYVPEKEYDDLARELKRVETSHNELNKMYDSLKLENKELEAEVNYNLIERQAELLTGVVNAIRGEPPEDTLWSHHDAPKLAQDLNQENEGLRERARGGEAVTDEGGTMASDTDDLVKRLCKRWLQEGGLEGSYDFKEAADTIERLERELAEANAVAARRIQEVEDQCDEARELYAQTDTLLAEASMELREARKVLEAARAVAWFDYSTCDPDVEYAVQQLRAAVMRLWAAEKRKSRE